MVGSRLLLILALTVPFGVVMGTSASCTAAEWSTGLCSSGSINGDHVDVGAETGGNGGSQASDGDDRNSDRGATTADDDCTGNVFCMNAGALDLPNLSLADLASFYPTKPTVSAEPNGWTVTGLDTNFYTGAKTHAASGTLLGQSATVRFTPTSFAWDYGDGTHITTSTGGRSWAALGVPEFSGTATSHVYATSGSYPVDLTVLYAAEYRVASANWHDVPGTLTLSAPTFTVVASDAKTVLVQRDCLLDPSGPGC